MVQIMASRLFKDIIRINDALLPYYSFAHRDMIQVSVEALRPESYHDANFAVTGGTGSSGTIGDSKVGIMTTLGFQPSPWASDQIPKIVGCACTGNAGNVFPVTAG